MTEPVLVAGEAPILIRQSGGATGGVSVVMASLSRIGVLIARRKLGATI